MSALAGRTTARGHGWVENHPPAEILAPREPHDAGVLCVVRWAVSRAALVAAQAGAHRGGPVDGRHRFTLAQRGEDPILEWTVSTRSACAQLVDGTSRTVLFESARDGSGSDGIRIAVVDQLVHISVDRRGVCVLTAVLRRCENRPVLYARTALLAELGIGGGRYEVLDGRVTSA